MMQFEKTAYLTQVKSIRLIAQKALEHYPIKVKNIELKRYAANATFKVTDSKNKEYQLRIHPKEWHTKAAILEEIKWLNHILKTTDIIAPRPIHSINNQFVIQCQHPSTALTRYCELFEWLPGRKRWHSINKDYAMELGLLIGKLHKSGQSMDIKHRYFWNADSMAGTSKARYYNVEKLTDVNKSQQIIITKARRAVYDQLKNYEKIYKNKSGLIHGDVQPNNILYLHNNIEIIDFDDCGVGLYVFELAGALHAFHQLTKTNKNKKYNELKEALFEGYSRMMSLKEEDIQLVPYCILAVRLMTIAWLEHNKDNLSLRQHYSPAIAGAIHYFKKLE